MSDDIHDGNAEYAEQCNSHTHTNSLQHGKNILVKQREDSKLVKWN